MACRSERGDRAPATGAATTIAGAPVIYREVQCLGNPWERAWLAAHPGEQFPTNEPARRDIFEAYWRVQGIDVADVRRERYLKEDEVVCQACTCPTGFEWRVRVAQDKVAAALALGFRPPGP